MFGFTNFTPTSDTAKSFLELRKSKNEEELKTKEWKSIEETYVKHLVGITNSEIIFLPLKPKTFPPILTNPKFLLLLSYYLICSASQ